VLTFRVIARQEREASILKSSVSAPFETNPQAALRRRGNGEDAIAPDVAVRCELESSELDSIEAEETSARTEPEVAIRCLRDAADAIRRQAILRVPSLTSVL
jgi:hypothetical protein